MKKFIQKLQATAITVLSFTMIGCTQSSYTKSHTLGKEYEIMATRVTEDLMEKAETKTVLLEQAIFQEMKAAAKRAEEERIAAEKAEAERKAAEEAERKRIEAEKAEAARIAAEQAEAARIAAEQAAAQQAAQQSQTTYQSSGWNGQVLTAWLGVVQGPSGKETYYNYPMQGVIDIMRSMGNYDEYWERSDGCKMLGNYIMVAANLNVHPRGSLVETSLGTGIVCDTGGFADADPYQLDIAVNW